jgi:hypothetical protein
MERVAPSPIRAERRNNRRGAAEARGAHNSEVVVSKTTAGKKLIYILFVFV